MKPIQQKLEKWGYYTVKSHDHNLKRSWVIHTCDRPTDGQTDRQTDGWAIAYSALRSCHALKIQSELQ